MARPKKLAKTPQWQDFEHLVAELHTSLSPDVQVIPNDHVLGRVSKRRRQIDIALRGMVGIYPIFVAIECRDYGRNLDVGQVEAYSRKLEDVGANKGVIVTTSNFSRGAVETAKHYGIDLLRVSDVPRHQWGDYFRPVDVTAMTFFLRVEQFEPLFAPVSDTEYNEITQAMKQVQGITVDFETLVMVFDNGETRAVSDILADIWEQRQERSLGTATIPIGFNRPARLVLPGPFGVPVVGLLLTIEVEAHVVQQEMPYASVRSMVRPESEAPIISRAITEAWQPASTFQSQLQVVTQDNFAQQSEEIQELISRALRRSGLYHELPDREGAGLRPSTPDDELTVSLASHLLRDDQFRLRVIVDVKPRESPG